MLINVLGSGYHLPSSMNKAGLQEGHVKGLERNVQVIMQPEIVSYCPCTTGQRGKLKTHHLNYSIS